MKSHFSATGRRPPVPIHHAHGPVNSLTSDLPPAISARQTTLPLLGSWWSVGFILPGSWCVVVQRKPPAEVLQLLMSKPYACSEWYFSAAPASYFVADVNSSCGIFDIYSEDNQLALFLWLFNLKYLLSCGMFSLWPGCLLLIAPWVGLSHNQTELRLSFSFNSMSRLYHFSLPLDEMVCACRFHHNLIPGTNITHFTGWNIHILPHICFLQS